MKNKIFLLVLASSLSFSLTSCRNNRNDSATPSTSTPAAVEIEAENPETTSNLIPEDEVKKEITAEDIFLAIEDAYGEDFHANDRLTEERLAEYEITDDLYDDFAGGSSFIGIYPDLVIVIKAKDDTVEEVISTLERLQQKKEEETVYYIMNQGKIKAATISRHNNYIAYIMAGKADDRAETTDSEKLEFAKKENDKGVEAFNNFFENFSEE